MSPLPSLTSPTSTAISHAIEEASADLRTLSLSIHDNPELAYKEVHAHSVLTRFLEDQGFTVTRGACGLPTAFIAEFESDAAKAAAARGEKVRTVGFCSEYDALPGVGHACGHNLIAISGVASVIGLKAALQTQQLPGKIRLLGTPAEETTGGKIPMLQQGAFDNLDACLMLHPAPGDVVYSTMLGVGGYQVEYFGRASHASASPWEGTNALDAMVTAYQSLALLRQQTLPTSRIHMIITNGGQAANIIPEYTCGKVMYRAVTVQELAKVHDNVVRVLKAAAESTGCTVKLENKEMEYKPLLHNGPMSERFTKYMTDLGVKYESKQLQESLPSGSTDMGDISHAMPSIHPMFNVVSLDSKFELGLSCHSIKFTAQAKTEVAHLATLRAAKGLAMTALDVLMEPGFAEYVKSDFEKRTLPVDDRAAAVAALTGKSGGCC